MKYANEITNVLKGIYPQIKQARITYLLNKIEKVYNEEHRFYHNLSHIEDMIEKLIKFKLLPQMPNHFLLAIVGHDWVYNIGSKTNEEDSAEEFGKVLKYCGIKKKDIEIVQFLIMSTIYSKESFTTFFTKDEQMLRDLDLINLGYPPEQFVNSNEAVYKEASQVMADADYRTGKIMFLSMLRGVQDLFKTPKLRAEYEHRAKANIDNCIGKLMNGWLY